MLNCCLQYFVLSFMLVDREAILGTGLGILTANLSKTTSVTGHPSLIRPVK